MNAHLRQQRGATLIEILVALLLCAFGLLGYVAMQTRATSLEFESYQRSQALVLLDDLVERMTARRTDAADFVSTSPLGAGALADCAGKTGADLDLCEWGNLLRGASETRSGAKIGAMTGARGCITRTNATEHRYLLSVAWVGSTPTGAPANTCGKDTSAFPDETLRRVVSATVCIAKLDNSTSAVSRC